MSDAAAIRIEQLSAMYGKVTAVTNVSLELAPNRIHALIGPSGCGKSTLLRTINRMHEEVPGAWTVGRVLLAGIDVHAAGISPMRLRRRVGMVFQKPTPFPTMSIFGNVAAGLRVGRRPGRRRMAELVEQSLRRAALWDEVKGRLHDRVSALSGGQRQRLCIARALAPGPEVLLLDEPTASLDPIATQRIEELLFELKRDYTIVIVTHNMQQAARASDTTTFLCDGVLVEHGRSEMIFTAPSIPRTEAYITGRFG